MGLNARERAELANRVAAENPHLNARERAAVFDRELGEAEGRARGMRADELQAIVLRLSNAHWCRYWLRWPVDGGFTMAVECIDYDGRSLPIRPIEDLGYRPDSDLSVSHRRIYVIPRLDESGRPYEGLR